MLGHMVALGLPRWLSGKEPTCSRQETQGMRVQSLGWEDPLEKGMATHSIILAWRISMDRGAWQAAVHGVTESEATEWLSTPLSQLCILSFQ